MALGMPSSLDMDVASSFDEDASLFITPVTAVLTITTFAPTVSTPRLVTPTTAVLSLTTFAPTVTAV